MKLLRTAPLLIATASLASLPQSLQPATSAEEVVDRLEMVLQPKFQDIDKLGVLSRIPRISGHENVILAKSNVKDRDALDSAHAANLAYDVTFVRVKDFPKLDEYRERLRKNGIPADQVEEKLPARLRAGGMVHIARSPGTVGQPEGLNGKLKEDAEDLTKIAAKQMAKLRRGDRLDENLKGLLVAYRPIKAVDKCLSCHSGTKSGDTLGTLRYVVARKPSTATD